MESPVRFVPLALLAALAVCPACKRGGSSKNPDCTTGTFLADGDGDGFGDDDDAVEACLDEVPQGYVSIGGDCDDDAAQSYPGADEVCDQRDNDCDGDVDEEPVDPRFFWQDGDGDGYGTNLFAGVEACSAPAGMVDNYLDCNDRDSQQNPDADEVCGDGEDNDCNELDTPDTCVPWETPVADVQVVGTSRGSIGFELDMGGGHQRRPSARPADQRAVRDVRSRRKGGRGASVWRGGPANRGVRGRAAQVGAGRRRQRDVRLDPRPRGRPER